MRAALEAGCPPTLLRIGDQLVVRHRGERRAESVLDARERELREACHVPAWMALFEASPAAEDVARWLRHVERRLERTREEAAREVLRLCRDGLASGDWLGEGWPRWHVRLHEPISACIERAAALETTRLDALTRRWLRALGADAGSAFFVVCAGHQPRYRQLSTQYFSALLAEDPGPGARGERRLLYAENCDSEEQALGVLAAQLVDRMLGERLWQRPFALQTDLLGGSAERAIARLFGRAEA